MYILRPSSPSVVLKCLISKHPCKFRALKIIEGFCPVCGYVIHFVFRGEVDPEL
jgi:hypothetical protein